MHCVFGVLAKNFGVRGRKLLSALPLFLGVCIFLQYFSQLINNTSYISSSLQGILNILAKGHITRELWPSVETLSYGVGLYGLLIESNGWAWWHMPLVLALRR